MREQISCNGSDDKLEKGPGARLESGGGAARVRSELWFTQLVAQSPRAPKVHVIEPITEPDIDRREELEGRFSLALMQRLSRAVGRDYELKGTGALAFCNHRRPVEQRRCLGICVTPACGVDGLGFKAIELRLENSL